MNEILKPKIFIVPCSGIGKSYGSVSREAGYILTEELRSDSSQLIPLSLLVLREPGVIEAIASAPVITIDGCKLACATKMVIESNGNPTSIAVLDVYRKHRHLKPQGIAELNQDGKKLANVLAEEMAEIVDRFSAGDSNG